MTTNLQIQLDPVALREATSQAIMGLLSPEVRAQIIQNAISALLLPSTNSWDRGISPLQSAFNQAVQQVARDVAQQEIVGNAEILAGLREMLLAVSKRVLSTEPEKLVERMADAFVQSVRAQDRS